MKLYSNKYVKALKVYWLLKIPHSTTILARACPHCLMRRLGHQWW